MGDALMDEFVRAYERMAADVERVVVQYPEEMREDLRAHAQEELRLRMQEMWAARQRQARGS
jgi:hypothetical protein